MFLREEEVVSLEILQLFSLVIVEADRAPERPLLSRQLESLIRFQNSRRRLALTVHFELGLPVF